MAYGFTPTTLYIDDIMYLVGELVALDARRVVNVRVIVVAIFDQVIYLCSVMIVLRVKFITGLSTPVLVGHHHAIPDHYSLEVYLCISYSCHLVCIDECTRKVRNVHTAV